MPKKTAMPEKRIFLSIIAEYDLKRSLCELIDNAIDLWKKSANEKLFVSLQLDTQRQIILITDNSGGVREENLDYLISPGKTSNELYDDVIGFFGVGSKRAVVALAQHITIRTRFEYEKTFEFTITDDWINNDPNWDFDYSESKNGLPPSTTEIELLKLRTALDDRSVNDLKKRFSEIYGVFIDAGLELMVNDETISSKRFESDWAYPKHYEPSSFVDDLQLDGRKVKVEITSGLIKYPGDPDNSYGVFMYCNNRLIARALTDSSVGFVSGLIGNPHYNISIARTIIKLNGQSRDMPWDSSKSGINTRHEVFRMLWNTIVEMTKKYAQISRGLQGKWKEEVFPFDTGTISTTQVDDIKQVSKNYMPSPPASKPRWLQKVKSANQSLVTKKPWTESFQDSIIAVDVISNLHLTHKNRVAFSVLDSTLEIAFKEFLAKEKKMGKENFDKAVQSRPTVQKTVCDLLKINDETIGKLNHYYQIRNELVHHRATPNISDKEVEDYRLIVEYLLNQMFGLNFNV